MRIMTSDVTILMQKCPGCAEILTMKFTEPVAFELDCPFCKRSLTGEMDDNHLLHFKLKKLKPRLLFAEEAAVA